MSLIYKEPNGGNHCSVFLFKKGEAIKNAVGVKHKSELLKLTNVLFC